VLQNRAHFVPITNVPQDPPLEAALAKVSDHLDHGIWTTRPPELVGDAAEWGSESEGFGAGTEGRVTYNPKTSRVDADPGPALG
jgi:hypothetical protein